LHPEDLKELLSGRTRLVTCTHASNILGTIHDIKGIAKMVHTIPGALLCIDAVAYAPHRQIDVKDLGVDFYAFSWYKARSPTLPFHLAADPTPANPPDYEKTSFSPPD
jgi:selenocysteine lyase/cysteine desulfurase